MTWSGVGIYLAAIALIALAPGPATALVIRRSALHGTKSVLPLVIGVEVGVFTWAVTSAFGVAALVSASQVAHLVLRVCGAAFLIYLGIRAWLSSGHAEPAPERSRPLLTGLVTNLANPKVAVFAFAFYPQFVPAGADVVATTVLLASVQVVVDGAWFLLLAAFVARARTFFTRTTVRRRLERVTGTVLIGLGLRLAVD